MIIQTYYGADFSFDSYRTEFDEQFIFWPRRCIITGKWLYLERVMHIVRHLKIDTGMRLWREHHYVDRHEALKVMMQL